MYTAIANKIPRKTIIESLNAAGLSIANNVVPALKDLIKLSKGKTNIITSATQFSSLGFKYDDEMFTLLLRKIKEYQSIIPKLKSAILDNLPDIIPVNSNNQNVRIVLSLVNIGYFLANDLLITLDYLVATYYLKESVPKTDIYSSIATKLNLVEYLIRDKKLKFTELVDLIGKLPNTSEIVGKSKNILPSTLIFNYLKRNLKINNKSTLNFLMNLFNAFRVDQRKTKQVNKALKDIVTPMGFIGNPIYHIRMFLADLEIEKLNSLKDKKRLLELRLAELRAKEAGVPGEEREKIKKQIEYIQTELEKTEAKIEAIIGDVDLRKSKGY